MLRDVSQHADGELVARTRRGDAAAFDALVRRYYRRAHAIALGILGNQMDAEDCVQEVFYKVVNVIEECRSPDRFAAWLAQIARNTARNALQARAVRHTDALDPDHPSPLAAHGRVAERDELRRRLEGALSTLNEMQRSVLLLHDLEGLDHQTIADTLDMSAVSSRQHLFNARRLMRVQLGANAITEYIHE